MDAKQFQDLCSIDRQCKPQDFDSELLISHQYYDDSTRAPTIASLRRLGLGLEHNPRPIQISMLRRVIDKLAVLYIRPATRWLVSNGEPYADDSDEHRLLLQIYERGQIDLAFRRIERLTALMRQVFVRVYPSDELGSVVLRLVEPYNVMREPSHSTPDVLESDRQFALRLSGGRYEHWYNRDGEWFYRQCNNDGDQLSEEIRNPYAQLPVHCIYDEYTGGHAWLAPRMSRVAWTENLNGVANDLQALIAHEAHTTKILKTESTKPIGNEDGPNVIMQIGPNDEYSQLSTSPHIVDCNAVLESFVRLWTLSEELPNSEFDRTKTVITGAARKVEMQSLLERRESKIPLAKRDEHKLFAKIAAVHNAHALTTPSWDLAELPDAKLAVEFSPLVIPSDEGQQQQADSRALILGYKSRVDVTQDQLAISRAEAIARLKRVDADNETFGVTGTGAAAPDLSEGTKLAQPSQTDALQQADAANVNAPVDNAPQGVAAVADTALNGAQVTALLEVVQNVALGQLPRDSAVRLVQIAFRLSAEQADQILGSIGKSFTPDPIVQPSAPPATPA